jgi:hypothetical protein
MDTWLTALFAAGGALAGSGLTGFITYKVARREHEARDVDELRTALVTYGAVLDRLGLRIDQMPHPPGPFGRWANRQVARWRDLDWVIGRISTATLGRGVIRIIDELTVATNRLILIAPQPVLEATEAINQLLDRIKLRDPQWKVEWQEARNALARVSRDAVPHL